MKEDSIQVLKIEPGKAPEAVTIPNTLKVKRLKKVSFCREERTP